MLCASEVARSGMDTHFVHISFADICARHSLRLHVQNPSSKMELLRIWRSQQQNIRPSAELFSVWCSMWLYRLHNLEAGHDPLEHILANIALTQYMVSLFVKWIVTSPTSYDVVRIKWLDIWISQQLPKQRCITTTPKPRGLQQQAFSLTYRPIGRLVGRVSGCRSARACLQALGLGLLHSSVPSLGTSKPQTMFSSWWIRGAQERGKHTAHWELLLTSHLRHSNDQSKSHGLSQWAGA